MVIKASSPISNKSIPGSVRDKGCCDFFSNLWKIFGRQNKIDNFNKLWRCFN